MLFRNTDCPPGILAKKNLVKPLPLSGDDYGVRSVLRLGLKASSLERCLGWQPRLFEHTDSHNRHPAKNFVQEAPRIGFFVLEQIRLGMTHDVLQAAALDGRRPLDELPFEPGRMGSV